MFIPLRCWVWVVGLALLDDLRPSAFFFFFFFYERNPERTQNSHLRVQEIPRECSWLTKILKIIEEKMSFFKNVNT